MTDRLDRQLAFLVEADRNAANLMGDIIGGGGS